MWAEGLVEASGPRYLQIYSCKTSRLYILAADEELIQPPGTMAVSPCPSISRFITRHCRACYMIVPPERTMLLVDGEIQ